MPRQAIRKTDNTSTVAKLELRRYFLRKYHADRPPAVLDCCQGAGRLWQTLQLEFDLASYWGVDIKPRRGRLALDSVRLLGQAGLEQDVIDVDTYGSPWRHWRALLPNIRRPVTVFLTLGRINTTPSSNAALAALGLADLSVPPALTMRLHLLADRYSLAEAHRHRLRFVEACEQLNQTRSRSGVQTRYLGIRLEPTAAPAGHPAA